MLFCVDLTWNDPSLTPPVILLYQTVNYVETEVEPSGKEPVLVTASVKMMCRNDEHKTHIIFL